MFGFAALLLLAAAAHSAGVQDGDANHATKAATDVARTKLAKNLSLEESSLGVVSVTPQTWPDSSLGCAAVGGTSAQVVTPGYEIIFSTPQGNYRVHATARYAVVCGTATEWRSSSRSAGLPLKNLNAMADVAKEDLAKRLHTASNSIKTTNFSAVTWPDSSMGCTVAGEKTVQQATKGYRIALEANGRVYTYNTDLSRVRACPEIAAE
jgi:hypothetical protein